MKAPPIEKPLVHIHIGGYHACRGPQIIATTLGSCVAVCLHEPFVGAGGMNHILLPGRPDLENFDDAARYGINAMELLINALLKLGCNRSRLRAKFFGGAHVLQAISSDRSPGEKNIAFVEAFLDREGIPLAAKEVGGVKPRKIWFHTDTGEVLVKHMSTVMHSPVTETERATLRRIQKEVYRPAEVSLFNQSEEKKSG